MEISVYAAVAAIAYLIGSIPTGALLARRYKNIDLTAVGSGSTGATNATRYLGTGAGAIVLIGDFAKGVVAVWLATQMVGTPVATGIAGFAAVFGHVHSIFLGGRGGRGIVTGLGGLAVAMPLLFVVAALAGCVTVAVSRYVSLGSLVGTGTAAAGGLIAYFNGYLPLELLIYILATALVVILAHAGNIARLRAGSERRLGQPAAPPLA